MTPAEIRAFNAGVAAVLELARTASAVLMVAAAHQQTCRDPMREALDPFAEKGEALLLPISPQDMR